MDDIHNQGFTKGGFSNLLERLLPTWRNRKDSEHEQAVLRLLVGLVAAGYLLIYLPLTSNDYPFFTQTLIAVVLFFISSFSILVWLHLRPGASKTRRLTGNIIDVFSATAALWINGNLAFPLFIVYLWVTFGNGFRFGLGYLLFSMIISLAGFCSVVLFSSNWHASPHLSIGMLTGLLVLPLYVASLLKRLNKAYELSEVANEAKSNFLATMSHEIRTPLNGVIGILDLLKKTELNKKQQRYMQLLNTSSDWLLQVISDGLDFTKIEANELIIDARPASLSLTLQKISSLYDEATSNKQVSFKSFFDPELPQQLEFDQFRLTQIINNLISNSIKFTQEGVVKLEARVIRKTDTLCQVNFLVSDTGIGIKKENIHAIFKPFHQAENNELKVDGTGLGLTISKNLVNLMGGNLRVTSEVNKGTTFSFELSLPSVTSEDIATTEKSYVKWLRSPQIILAEDNKINQEVAINLLENLGCQVILAENGAEAVKHAKAQTVDLILMDCQMPLLDGYGATKQICALSEELGKVPVIALTAHTTLQDRKRCFQVGMVDYMGKPYREEKLKLLLHKWLAHLIKEVKLEPAPAEVEVLQKEKSLRSKTARTKIHDLRNCLTAVLGSTQLAILHQNQPEKASKQLKNALEATERSIQITEEL